MKTKILFTAMALLLMVACVEKEQETAPEVLLEENIAAKFPDWQVLPDTITQDFTLTVGYNTCYDVPFRLQWLWAVEITDSITIYSVAYCKLERLGGSNRVKIPVIQYSMSPGDVSGWNDDVTYRFRLSEIFGVISAPKYEQTGEILLINYGSLGTVRINDFINCYVETE